MNSPAYSYQADRVDEALITRHAPLVKRIAFHVGGRLPDSIQMDDLLQAGMIGLLEAARHFDATHGASFETYASIRIRGAILDEVRRHNWLPRSVFTKARSIAEAIRQVENRTGHGASDSAIAEELGIPVSDYHSLLREARGQQVIHLQDYSQEGEDQCDLIADQQGDVTERLEMEEFRCQLTEQIAALPEKEKMVMALYYSEELNLREIGEVLGVSESRISQIRSQALLRLRSRLDE